MMHLPGPDASHWDRLAERSRNVFLTRDFAECWWAVYGGSGRPMVLVDAEHEPDVVLPLYLTGRPLRQVRQIGNGPADELGPVCAPEHLEIAAQVLRDGLSRSRSWDVLLLQDVPLEQAWDRRTGGQEVRTVPSPVVHLRTTDWDAFLAGRSKNFREQARRRERKLRAAFEVVLRVSTRSTLDDDLDVLFRLHLLRWGHGAPFAVPPQSELVRRFARRAQAAGRLRLSVLELDGVPVAAQLGLRFAGVHSLWQGGRDPSYDDHSAGSVLFLDALRAAVEDSASEYRLLRGEEAYKGRFADADRPVHTVALGRGPLGAAAVGLVRRSRSRR